MTVVRRFESLGIPVDAVSFETIEQRFNEILDSKSRFLTTFVNPASVVLAKRSPDYANFLRQFDFVLPDGIGLAMGCRWLHREHFTRVSFDSTSLAPLVFRLATERNLPLILVGGQPGVADRAASQIKMAFPGVPIIATLHGFHERDRIVSDILRLNPSIVVCGMGALVQERLLLELAGSWQGAGFTCGGYLDQLHRGLRYYPEWINRMHLRAAYRLFREPRRLGRRYLLEYPEYGVRLFRAMVNNEKRE